MPWKGDEAQRPDRDVCFAIPKVHDLEGFEKISEEKTTVYTFCVIENADGTAALKKNAELLRNQLITNFNSLYRYNNQRSAILALKEDGDNKLGTSFLFSIVNSFVKSVTSTCESEENGKSDE